MRRLMTVLVAVFCVRCSAESVWHLAMTADKRGQVLSVSNSVLSVTLAEQAYWTIREIRFGGTLMVGAFGANGAVASVKPAARLPEAKDGWMGTGHGFESIASYVIELDGKAVTLKPGERADARVVTLTKASNIGPLDQVAVIVFPATGDRLVERTRFTANRPLADSLSFVYAYMHCNDNALTEWRAWLDSTQTLDGSCAKDDASNALMKEMLAVAMFAPTTNKGLVYLYPEVYQGGPKGNFFWDRTRDNKLYFKPKIPGVINLPGETVTYDLTVVPFTAVADDWHDKAEKIMRSLQSKQ